MSLFKKVLILLCVNVLLTACSEVDSNVKEKEFESKDKVQEVERETSKDPVVIVEETNEVKSKATEPEKKPATDKPSYYVEEPIGPTFKAVVTKVTDGDTIKVKFDGKEESVRLLLIDTPETVHPSKPVQPFGKEASNFAKEFFPIGSEVDIDIDVSERDKYGRLLAYVWKDGILYQDAILNEGLARVAYIYAPNTAYVDSFRKNQEQAQKRAVGIWSIENYASEDGFNENEKVEGATQKPSVTPPVTTTEKPNQSSTPPSTAVGSIVDANGDGVCNDVKGNVGSKDKIYHIPGGSSYEKTVAEELFCTTVEAESAGYRASKR